MGNLLRCHCNPAGRRRRGSAKSATAEEAVAKAAAKPAAAAVTDSADGGSYAEKARIDDEVLVVRYLHLMNPTAGEGTRRRHGSGSCRVSFRAESFDSQSSTTSERREFIVDLVDSLPETFVDDALPPASARGRLASWSSCSDGAATAAADADGPEEPVVFAADTAWPEAEGQRRLPVEIPSAS